MTALPVPPQDVTELLLDWSAGNQAALDKLMPLVYRELSRMAHNYLNRERRQTLQTTELVHEAYVRLVDQKRVRWQNQAHFYGVAAQLMRRILVDRARHHKRAKRGGGAPLLSLDQNIAATAQSTVDLLALDEALHELAKLDQRKARIIELRFFGGLEVDETAAFLNISSITVMRDWKLAKAWLHRALSGSSENALSSSSEN